jgi:hypothetical protein
VEGLRERGHDELLAAGGGAVTPTSVPKALATGLLLRVTRSLWGLPPNLIAEIVERLGALGSLAWFVQNLPRYELTMKVWGPLRTHAACLGASLMNGCSYCVYAHSYAFELYYFRERGELFPFDEHQIVALRDKSDVELRKVLDDAFRATRLTVEANDLATLCALKFSERMPHGRDERRLAHILQMFDILNYCGLDSLATFDEAHDPINKDAALRARYAEARLKHRRA